MDQADAAISWEVLGSSWPINSGRSLAANDATPTNPGTIASNFPKRIQVLLGADSVAKDAALDLGICQPEFGGSGRLYLGASKDSAGRIGSVQ
jgi:hypothetical protein